MEETIWVMLCELLSSGSWQYVTIKKDYDMNHHCENLKSHTIFEVLIKIHHIMCILNFCSSLYILLFLNVTSGFYKNYDDITLWVFTGQIKFKFLECSRSYSENINL